MSHRISTLILLDQNPTLMTTFNLSYFLKAPSSNTATLGVRTSIYEIGGQGSEDKSGKEDKHSVHDKAY